MEIDFATARQKMVDNQIRTTDVTTHTLLSAFLSVAREDFVPDGQRALAYIDSDIELDVAGRFLIEPSPLAKLLQAADISKADKVLEIGAGSGYVSAILSHLASSVIAVERDSQLVLKAREALAGSHENVEIVESDFERGRPAFAPYDVIFVNGSIETEPQKLFEQMAENGRMVAVVGVGGAAQALLYIKENGHVSSRRLFNISIPRLPGFEKEEAFVF